MDNTLFQHIVLLALKNIINILLNAHNFDPERPTTKKANKVVEMIEAYTGKG